MVSLAKVFWRWMTNKQKKDRDRILREIDEEKIKDNKRIKEQAQYIQVLEAQESRRQAKERAKKVEQKDKEDDIDLIKKLEQRQVEIDKEQYEGAYDLFALARRLDKNKKFREKLEIRDKDNIKVFDKFKTILILKEGDIGIQGRSGEIWASGPTLRHIIHKPESLRNQIRDGRILLPYDENFKYIEDLENLEVPEVSYNDKKEEWQNSEERLEPLKDLLIKRSKKNQELREDKKAHEQIIADLRNKVQDLELAKDAWKSQTENSQSELGVALENEKQINKKFGQMDRDLTTAQEQKELANKIIDVYELSFKEKLGELEDEKSKTQARKARLEVFRDIKRYKKLLPKQVEAEVEDVEEPKEVVKPGDKV